MARAESLKRRTALVMAVLGVLVALALCVVFFRPSRETTADYEAALRETTRIVLVYYNPHPGGEVVLTDNTDEVRELVGDIQLVAKDPCKCSFEEHIVFHTPKGQIKVYISGHAFNPVVDDKFQHYEMPERFWEAFQGYRKRAMGEGAR